MPDTITVFSWRDAIQKSTLKPTTRFVLLNLSVWMNNIGLTCWPSIAEQATTSGLSERAVTVNLQHAVKAGFLARVLVRDNGERWAHYVYEATYPSHMHLPRASGFQKSQGELGSGGKNPRPDPNDNITPQEDHTNSPLNSPIEEIDKKTKAKKPKRGTKILIADWEVTAGKLAVPMMRQWIDGNQLDPAKVHAMIVEFRDRMAAGGNLYADFAAAFKDWLRRGFLSRKLDQCKLDKVAHATEDLSMGGLKL